MLSVIGSIIVRIVAWNKSMLSFIKLWFLTGVSMEDGKPFTSLQTPQVRKRTWVPNKCWDAFEPRASLIEVKILLATPPKTYKADWGLNNSKKLTKRSISSWIPWLDSNHTHNHHTRLTILRSMDPNITTFWWSVNMALF